MLALSMGHLEKLVDLPRACGEQNMVLVAPSVSVLKYLDYLDIRKAPIRTRALAILEDGSRSRKRDCYWGGAVGIPDILVSWFEDAVLFGSYGLVRQTPPDRWLRPFGRFAGALVSSCFTTFRESEGVQRFFSQTLFIALVGLAPDTNQGSRATSFSFPPDVVPHSQRVHVAVAQPYILVDQGMMLRAALWLATNQGPGGEFAEAGLVVLTEMRRCRDDCPAALTAFVLMALLEDKTYANCQQNGDTMTSETREEEEEG
ncbi:hypothetical protein CRUP_005697 [Coryphaenoides rupestris]|nr:hypothetical protein CRUP_005697 [Coryphaenoides rupestris]